MVLKISTRETHWFLNQPEANGSPPLQDFPPTIGVQKNHLVEFPEKMAVALESMNISQQKHLFLGSKKDYFCQAYLDTVWMRSYFWFRRKKSTSNLSVSPYQSTVSEPKSWTASACPSSVSITSWWVGWLSSDPNSTAVWNGRNSPPVKSPNPATRLTQKILRNKPRGVFPFPKGEDLKNVFWGKKPLNEYKMNRSYCWHHTELCLEFPQLATTFAGRWTTGVVTKNPSPISSKREIGKVGKWRDR